MPNCTTLVAARGSPGISTSQLQFVDFIAFHFGADLVLIKEEANAEIHSEVPMPAAARSIQGHLRCRVGRCSVDEMIAFIGSVAAMAIATGDEDRRDWHLEVPQFASNREPGAAAGICIYNDQIGAGAGLVTQAGATDALQQVATCS